MGGGCFVFLFFVFFLFILFLICFFRIMKKIKINKIESFYLFINFLKWISTLHNCSIAASKLNIFIFSKTTHFGICQKVLRHFRMCIFMPKCFLSFQINK